MANQPQTPSYDQAQHPGDAELESVIASGKRFLGHALRNLQKMKERLKPDVLAPYSKFKVVKNAKTPSCRWADPQNHTKATISPVH